MESSSELTYEQHLENQRRVFNKKLGELPESYKCSMCQKEARLIKLNDRVAFYIHDCDTLKDIPMITNTNVLWRKLSFGSFDAEQGRIRVILDDEE